MATTLYALLEQSATAALDLQRQDGAMPAGHNGPYRDPETPVRNTSHWLITFRKAHQITGEQKFWKAARRAADYLLSREARPMEATFWHRKNPEKDSCNGLIGQAWTIEALVAAADLFEEEKFIRLAEEVFLLHPFRDELGLWHRTAADGQHLQLDYTLNHQIWFAASGALLAPHAGKEVGRQVDRFMNQLGRHFRTYASGLIQHRMKSTFSWRKHVKVLLRQARQSRAERRAWTSKEVGYHQFNLYGLGLLYKQYPEHDFWDSKPFEKACRYVRSDEYRKGIQDSPYGFPYNPPGFEVAFALDVFVDLFGEATEEEQQDWVVEQFKRCYDWSSHLMRRNAPDPTTHAARLYEAIRLPDMEVSGPGAASALQKGEKKMHNA